MKQLLILLLFSSFILAQERILLDENYEDWNGVSSTHSDAPDDGTGGSGNIDFEDFWVSNDNEYLYFRIQTGDEIVLVDDAFDNHYLTLFIDTDNNSSTGRSVNGVGAELEYNFSDRDGKTYFNGSEQDIDHKNIDFFGSPTYSAKQFEFAISRSSVIDGNQLFPGQSIKIVFAAYDNWQQFNLFDITPDNGGFEYTFQTTGDLPEPDYSIKKTNIGYLRAVAFNTAYDWDSDDRINEMLKPENADEFDRVFDAIEPDIIGFSEMYNTSSQQVADKMEEFLPSENGEQWYHEKEFDYDLVLVSRFLIKESYPIETRDITNAHNASSAFLLDLRPKYDSDMLVLVAHPKCCGGSENDDKRQYQFDAMIEFLRDAMTDGGNVTVTQDIPILVMGDMNLVGDRRQYKTLTTGDILSEGLFGEDFSPDWDGSSLDDSIPFVNNTVMTYTTNAGGYPPGRLDYILYTGSVMGVVNSFIFNTATLSNEELSEYGLNTDDTKVSDHLPVVADFDLSPITGIKKKDDAPKEFGLMQNYPNPFNPTTTIKFTIPVETQHAVSLRIYNPLGQEVSTLVNKSFNPGSYEVTFDASDLSSGIYYYKLTAGNFTETKKMLLIK